MKDKINYTVIASGKKFNKINGRKLDSPFKVDLVVCNNFDFKKNTLFENLREGLLKYKIEIMPEHATAISMYLNPLLQNSQANQTKYIGCLSQIRNDYLESEECKKAKSLQDYYDNFRKYYFTKYGENFKKALKRFSDYVLKKEYELAHVFKREMNTETINILNDICRIYLEDLVIYKTINGFIIEQCIIDYYKEKLGKEYTISKDVKDEPKGIDFRIDGKPYTVKPYTYKVDVNKNKNNAEGQMIMYKIDEKRGLVFYEVPNFRA